MVCVCVCAECSVCVDGVGSAVLIAFEGFAGVPDRLFGLLQSASHTLLLLETASAAFPVFELLESMLTRQSCHLPIPRVFKFHFILIFFSISLLAPSSYFNSC